MQIWLAKVYDLETNEPTFYYFSDLATLQSTIANTWSRMKDTIRSSWTADHKIFFVDQKEDGRVLCEAQLIEYTLHTRPTHF